LRVIPSMVVNRTYNDISRSSDFGGQLMYLYDADQGVFRPVNTADLASSSQSTGSSTVSSTSISGVNGTCLPRNLSRNSYFIQNLSTGSALFVKLGTGASSTSFNFILKADNVPNGGNGGSSADDVWKGDVSCFGNVDISYVAWEV